MLQELLSVDSDTRSQLNWVIGSSMKALDRIHQKDINITIVERDINALIPEIDELIIRNIQLRSNGNIDSIMKEVTQALSSFNCRLILEDINDLLHRFTSLVPVEECRLQLATIATDMCRRFHTDINDLRLLCTYSGPGTLWLTDDNINKNALEHSSGNGDIVIDKNRIQQAQTGSVVLLKGAFYPGEETKAIVHRSPIIEKNNTKRLLLRIDTNQTVDLWK